MPIVSTVGVSVTDRAHALLISPSVRRHVDLVIIVVVSRNSKPIRTVNYTIFSAQQAILDNR